MRLTWPRDHEARRHRVRARRRTDYTDRCREVARRVIGSVSNTRTNRVTHTAASTYGDTNRYAIDVAPALAVCDTYGAAGKYHAAAGGNGAAEVQILDRSISSGKLGRRTD